MPRRMEKFLQIAPHSLAIVLSACGGDEVASGAPRRQPDETREEGSGGGGGGEVAAGEEDEYRDREGEEGPRSRAPRGELPPGTQLGRHHIGYEIFADFKQENMQNFWNKKVTAAVAETFFLGWIDEQVLLIQGKEEHLEVLREGWMRRALKPPAGFHIKCLEFCLGNFRRMLEGCSPKL